MHNGNQNTQDESAKTQAGKVEGIANRRNLKIVFALKLRVTIQLVSRKLKKDLGFKLHEIKRLGTTS